MSWLPSIPTIIAQLGLIFVVFNMLVLSAAFMVWMERKVCAYIQDRSGPNRVGFEGVLQPFADVIKLLFKEQLKPKAADTLLFALAPLVSTTAAFAAFSVVPFGTETTLFGLLEQPIPLEITDVNVAVLVDLRDHVDGHLRDRARRLELEQQVFAARRPPVVGADDQLRAVVRPGDGGRHHDGRVAVAARHRDGPVRARGSDSSRAGTCSCSRSGS